MLQFGFSTPPSEEVSLYMTSMFLVFLCLDFEWYLFNFLPYKLRGTLIEIKKGKVSYLGSDSRAVIAVKLMFRTWEKSLWGPDISREISDMGGRIFTLKLCQYLYRCFLLHNGRALSLLVTSGLYTCLALKSVAQFSGCATHLTMSYGRDTVHGGMEYQKCPQHSWN